MNALVVLLLAVATVCLLLAKGLGRSLSESAAMTTDNTNEPWKIAFDLRVKQSERLAQEVVTQHSMIVEKFLALAENRVSTLDEYGDENWKALSKEVARCIEKLAEVEGKCLSAGEGSSYFWVKEGAYGTVTLDSTTLSYEARYLYENIRGILGQRFRAYLAGESARQRNADEIARMTGVEFETYLMRVLKQQGCSVRGTPRTGDKGADIIATFREKVIVVQAKRSAAAVGVRAIQEIVASVAHYNAAEAWVITNSTFTQQARELAQRNAVRLVSGAELPRLGEFLQKSDSA